MAGRIVEAVPFSPTVEDIADPIRLDACPELEGEVEMFLAAVSSVARPRAAYRLCSASAGEGAMGDGAVTVCDATFMSPALAAACGGSRVAVVYVATCGPELDALDLSGYDPLAFYWLAVVKDSALAAITRALTREIGAALGTPAVVHLHPGSAGGDVWAIEDQRALFSLFEDAETDSAAQQVVGVRLTESCLMKPDKSVSGIAFPIASLASDPATPARNR